MVEFLGKPAVYGPGSPMRRYCDGRSKPAFIRVFSTSRLVTANADDIEYMLSLKTAGFRKGRGYIVLQRILGNGLVTLIDDDQHAIHRREVSPAFSPAALKHIADVCVPEHARALTTELDSCVGEKVPIQKLMLRAALCVMAQAAFRTNDNKTNDLVAQCFTQAMSNGWSLPRLSPVIDKMLIFQNAKIHDARQKMRVLVEDIKKACSAEDAPTERNAKALIDFMLSSPKLDTTALMDHSITFMFAGYDTTSNAMTWMAYLLSQNHGAQDKLYEELSAVVALGSCPKVDDLKSCKYLYSCIKETLRLYGPVPTLARAAGDDDVLPGTKCFVPKGMLILMPLAVLHRNKQVWGDDSDEFRPERWEEDDFDAKVASHFMPFSIGRRNCIGKDFAMNEMALLAAAVYRNFKLSWPADEPEVFPEALPILRPKAPFNVEVEKRSH